MPEEIRVRAIVVDPSPLAYTSIRDCLSLGGHLVLGQAHDFGEALLQLETLRPELVVIGWNLSEDESLAVCREIICRYQDIKIIILAKQSGDPLFQADAAYSGATACLPETVSHQEILAVVEAVMSGHRLFAYEILLQGFEKIELSEREREVLQLLAEGKTNREIARALSVEFTTVRTHSKNIIEKFGVHNRQEAVRRARRRGFLK